jgi:hypothetical protein
MKPKAPKGLSEYEVRYWHRGVRAYHGGGLLQQTRNVGIAQRAYTSGYAAAQAAEYADAATDAWRARMD